MEASRSAAAWGFARMFFKVSREGRFQFGKGRQQLNHIGRIFFLDGNASWILEGDVDQPLAPEHEEAAAQNDQRQDDDQDDIPDIGRGFPKRHGIISLGVIHHVGRGDNNCGCRSC